MAFASLLATLATLARPSSRNQPRFASRNGTLWMDDQPLVLKGVNWYGFETAQGVVHGLYAQPISTFMGILQSNGFNAVRIPLDLDLALHDRKHGYIKPDPGVAASEDCFEAAVQHEERMEPGADEETLRQRAALRAGDCAGPSPLMKNSSLEVLDVLIDDFAARGVLVLLDLHCLSTAGTNASPLWFDASHPVADTLKGWTTLAARFGSKWNVIGADIFNEPFAGTWAEGKPTDMDAFAVAAAAAIRAGGAPQWLVFVEGTWRSPNCTSVVDGDTVDCGYGDNLLGAMHSPVDIGAAERLVFSMHT
jgi:aryl-phospho-beta-D-glucosidase BglC (GH1 family)